MTKEEILQQVKDSFAQEQGFTDWEEYYYDEGSDFNELEINQIAERYAVLMCEEQKKECLESLRIKETWSDFDDKMISYEIEGQSVLKAKNVAE